MLKYLPLAFVLLATPALAETIPPFNRTVETVIRPREEALLKLLVKDGRDAVLDGIPVFNGKDKFLPGKIALGLSDLLVSLPKDDPRLPQYLADFRTIAAMTVDDTNDSWGAYYYLYSLNRLRKAGLLDQAVDRLTLAKLRVRLDWRMFVDPDSYDLIDHPNNYYVVAFGIARLREEMGWEKGGPSQAIYARVAEQYHLHSGPYGFADEMSGQGRFDRYSVLLAGELANHFLATGEQPPAEVLGWLDKSADVMLMRIHADGAGFEYGRSLGPYGETAIVETLTAAARTGLLSDDEKVLAYAYAARAAQRYAEFWVDRETGSVNLWDNGRRTDAYRGKFRILGENLSLGHQFAYTNAAWNEMGYHDTAPVEDMVARIERLPRQAVTWFARSEYDRVLVTRRDRGHIIGLPLINGGDSQHDHNPYYPIPFSRGMIEGVADGDAPLLVPRIELADGTKLMPLAWFRDVSVVEADGRTTVSYRQSELDRLGQKGPVKDDRFSVVTTYVFETGRIVRTDVFTPKAPVDVATIRLEFATFSTGVGGKANAFVFGEGAVTGLSVEGLDCSATPVGNDPDYRSDTGAFRSLIRCERGAAKATKPFTVSWTLRYQ